MNSLLEKKFEGFSSLSDEECGRIIESYLLEGLESETLLEREMMTKFLSYPYVGREPIRKIFNVAIKRNKQKMASFTVGEWLEKYIKAYEGRERTPNTFFEFVNNNPETRNLNKIDKIRLMRIFRMYDYLLVEPMPGLDDIRMNILRFPMYLNEESLEIPIYQKNELKQSYVEEKPRETINLAIQSALKQYPQLGEQLISSAGIKIKYFNSPVRPSIKNWIADYNEVMGVENHDMMKRGDYLFHSENGKRLTTGERQKVAEILKSYDESSMLSIDPQRQEAVFSAQNNEVRIGSKPENQSPAISRQLFSPSASRNGPAASSQRTSASSYQPPERNYQKPIPNNNPPIISNQRPDVFRQGPNSISQGTKNFFNEKPIEKPILDEEKEEKIKNFFNTQEAVNPQTKNLNSWNLGAGVNHKENIQQPSAVNRQLFSPSANQSGPTANIQRTSVVPQHLPVINPKPKDNVNFSSSHKFPAENNVSSNKNNAGENIPRRNISETASGNKRNPYIINPHLYEDNGPKIQGNVVDLRQ